MVKKKYKVIISHTAKQALKQNIGYIRQDSPSAAEKVKKELLAIISSLSTMPKRYAKEELLPANINDYRSVCRWHFKIVYKVTEREVIVLTIFHTSRHPEQLETEI